MKKRVLLVDDEQGIRTSLRMVLEPTYEVDEAANAQTIDLGEKLGR